MKIRVFKPYSSIVNGKYRISNSAVMCKGLLILLQELEDQVIREKKNRERVAQTAAESTLLTEDLRLKISEANRKRRESK